MKKQILFMAVTISAIVFVSCRKEKIEASQTDNAAGPSTPANSQKMGGGVPSAALSKGLLGRFEFNNTLRDTTGQLADGISTANRVLYTTDRKGVANRAILFNEGYGITLFNVPLDTNMSVAVWLKKDIYPVDYQIPVVEGSQGLSFAHYLDTYQAGSWNGVSGQYVVSGPIDNKWHHLAASRDATSLKFYIDGNLVGSAPTPAGGGPSAVLSDYTIGYGYNAGYKYWKGSMDDFRIYRRVLSPNDVVSLYNL